jgi:hypothetical protein
MRQVINPQLEFGGVDISQIKFDLKSRDDMPRILRGLQHVYVTDSLRQPIFALLEKEILPTVNKGNGRQGMALWTILVLGVLRLDLNIDYDHLHELVNNHYTLRQMLGHADFFDKTYYHVQTLKDNVSLLSEELLIQLNEIIVNGGHALVTKKSGGEVLHGRCDSFVVETNVHYPTDSNLLLDAMRKAIFLSADLCEKFELSDLRQYRHNFRNLKQAQRKIQKVKRGKSAEDKVVATYQEYIQLAEFELSKIAPVLINLEQLPELSALDKLQLGEIKGYVTHAERQIDQIERRVIRGEIIPHQEKIFSIFEPHTEWISKGKAGVPVELGMRVCVLEDQHQFILHHMVMEKETDDKVAVGMVEASQKKFPQLKAVSFDKGFHSQTNQEDLAKLLETVALPRKGRLSKNAQEKESSVEFAKARKKHSAVESCINGLEVHGLDRCPDHGITGFKRYVALAVVTRNLHRIGEILHRREQKSAIKMQKAANAANLQHAA